jgi:hypothetical protein
MRQASRIWITRATSCRGRSVPRGTVGRDGGHAVPMSRCEADIGGFEPAKTCPATRRWYTLVIHNVRTGRLTKPYFIGFLGLPEPAAESPLPLRQLPDRDEKPSKIRLSVAPLGRSEVTLPMAPLYQKSARYFARRDLQLRPPPAKRWSRNVNNGSKPPRVRHS